MMGFPEKHSFSGSGRVDGRQGGAEPAEQKISNYWGLLLVETGPFYMPVWSDSKIKKSVDKLVSIC